MRAFRNFSIRQKLMAMLLVTSSIVMLLVASALAVNEILTLRSSIHTHLTTLADIISLNAELLTWR
jgi:sensor histidine kinase regulating citrate/malate metabolism